MKPFQMTKLDCIQKTTRSSPSTGLHQVWNCDCGSSVVCLLSEVAIECVKEWYLFFDLVGMCVQNETEIACILFQKCV